MYFRRESEEVLHKAVIMGSSFLLLGYCWVRFVSLVSVDRRGNKGFRVEDCIQKVESAGKGFMDGVVRLGDKTSA